MKATIQPFSTTLGDRHIITLTDDAGGVIERIVVSEVVMEGDPFVRTDEHITAQTGRA